MAVVIVGLIRTGQTVQKVPVLIAVEPAPLSRVIEHLLRGRPEYRVVSRSSGGAGLARHASRLQPALIILNMRLLGCDASKIIQEIKLASPGSKLIVTGFPQGLREHVRECGADAYLDEEHLVRLLVRTVRRLLAQPRPRQATIARPRTTSASFSARLARTYIFADFGRVLGK